VQFETLIDAWRDFRRTWLQLTVADLMACVAGVVILAPLVGLLLKLFLVTTAAGVVTDGAIVMFLLHPTGMVALVVVATVSLAILFAETGQLMVIGFGAIEDRHVTWLDALFYVYRRAVPLLRFAGRAVIRLLVIMLPFLAAVGALYLLFLQTYDINYYLTEKPPVFWLVAAVAGLLLTAMAGLIIHRIAGWLFAVPMILFEGLSGTEAMRASQEVTKDHLRKLMVGLIAWVLGVFLLLATVTFVVGLVGDLLIPRETSHLGWFLTALTAVLVLTGVSNFAIAVFTTVMFPLCVVRLYRALGGPGELSPPMASKGTLRSKTPWRVPGVPILLAGGAVLVGLGFGGYWMLEGIDSGGSAVIIAHRGGAAVAPENTMAAFERGIADGADYLELDVQEDADGVVIVEHDRDFMRAAGSNLEVWNATQAELAGLDIGGFFSPEFSDQRVPTLEEVLKLAKDRVGVFIELKYYGHDIDLEGKVVKLVESTGMSSNIVIMSLDYDGVRKTAALRPDWTYGLLNAVALGDLTRLKVNFLALTADAASFTTIRRAHQRGMKVYAWTIDDPVQMSVMLSRGVDGIITDKVSVARQVMELREKLTPLGRILVWMAGETGLLRGMEESSKRDEA